MLVVFPQGVQIVTDPRAVKVDPVTAVKDLRFIHNAYVQTTREKVANRLQSLLIETDKPIKWRQLQFPMIMKQVDL